MSVVSEGHAAVVDSPLTKIKAQECVIQGTVSKCIAIGRTRRIALKENKEPVAAVRGDLRNGRLLLQGKVEKYTWRDEKGFLFGDATVEGTGKWGRKGSGVG